MTTLSKAKAALEFARGVYVAYEIFVDVPKITAEAIEPVKGKR